MLPSEIVDKVRKKLSLIGLESHPFKIGWYNDLPIDEVYRFPYDYDTLAINTLSTPDMFEKGLVPYICKTDSNGSVDKHVIDNFIAAQFREIKQELSEFDIEAIQDFEMVPIDQPGHESEAANHYQRKDVHQDPRDENLPKLRPKILVQTAGHVSGAAYYYQRKDVQPDPWDKQAKIFGVSIHPEYGGWFAFRGTLIFKNVTWADLAQPAPVDVVSSYEERKELLERFNTPKDWTYRDIIPVKKKYSDEQKEYFQTPLDKRLAVIERIRHRHQVLCSNTVGNLDQDHKKFMLI